MTFFIGQDNYFKRLQPAKTEELINLVQVPIAPLTSVTVKDYNDSIYTGEPILFESAELRTVEINYTKVPVKDAEAIAYLSDEEGDLTEDDITGEITNAQLTITNPVFYAWGASLTIENSESSEQYVVIKVGGYHLKDEGKGIIEASDSAGIIENGVLKYKVKKNHLIQSRPLGQSIADTLLTAFSIVRKDVTLDYRGNLCLRLMDEIETIEYNRDGIYSTGNFYLYKIQSVYDGTFKQTLNGRKIE